MQNRLRRRSSLHLRDDGKRRQYRRTNEYFTHGGPLCAC